MAVTMVPKGSGELGNLLKDFHKKYGEGIGGQGVKIKRIPRIPTGIFPLDLALGGGFPRSRLCIVYGPEGSGKSNLALLCCAYVQSHCAVCDKATEDCICEEGPTVLKAVYIDLEHTYDALWAGKLGINNEEIILLQPEYAEQAADIIEAVLHAADVGIVVVDSMAALTTTAMIENSAEKAEMGGSALVTTKLVKKATMALSGESKREHHPLLLCINQVRTQLGQYGAPEGQPGGKALQFASSMTVRINGKELFEKEISQTLPTFKETSVIIRKWKAPIVAKTCAYNLCVLEHEGRAVGSVDDWNTVSNYLKDYGVLGKTDKNKWNCIHPDGELVEYQTLTAIRAKYDAEPEFNAFLKKIVVDTELKTKGINQSGNDL
jgi:recombination protein RecA